MWAAIAQSSAYCKSTMDIAFAFVFALRRRMLNSSTSVPLAWSTAASDIKAARNIVNSVGAITQPCFTPVLMLNDPDWSPSYSTHPFMPLCSCLVMLTNVGGHPSPARHAHMASLFTESNASLRSVNAKQKSRPCSLHFSCTCMTGRENHVRSAWSWSETTLCFGDNYFRERLKSIQENFRQDLSSD